MPTVSASIDVQTSTPSPDIFRAVFTITAVLDFPDKSLFVVRSSDDTFDRVASIYDLSAWPLTKTPGVEYYRQEAVTVDYTSLAIGGQAVRDIPGRVSSLVEQYAQYQGEFAADFAQTYSETY